MLHLTLTNRVLRQKCEQKNGKHICICNHLWLRQSEFFIKIGFTTLILRYYMTPGILLYRDHYVAPEAKGINRGLSHLNRGVW